MFVISFVALFVIIYNVYGFRLDLLPVCLDGILWFKHLTMYVARCVLIRLEQSKYSTFSSNWPNFWRSVNSLLTLSFNNLSYCTFKLDLNRLQTHQNEKSANFELLKRNLLKSTSYKLDLCRILKFKNQGKKMAKGPKYHTRRHNIPYMWYCEEERNGVTLHSWIRDGRCISAKQRYNTPYSLMRVHDKFALVKNKNKQQQYKHTNW